MERWAPICSPGKKLPLAHPPAPLPPLAIPTHTTAHPGRVSHRSTQGPQFAPVHTCKPTGS